MLCKLETLTCEGPQIKFWLNELQWTLHFLLQIRVLFSPWKVWTPLIWRNPEALSTNILNKVIYLVQNTNICLDQFFCYIHFLQFCLILQHCDLFFFYEEKWKELGKTGFYFDLPLGQCSFCLWLYTALYHISVNVFLIKCNSWIKTPFKWIQFHFDFWWWHFLGRFSTRNTRSEMFVAVSVSGSALTNSIQ